MRHLFTKLNKSLMEASLCNCRTQRFSQALSDFFGSLLYLKQEESLIFAHPHGSLEFSDILRTIFLVIFRSVRSVTKRLELIDTIDVHVRLTRLYWSLRICFKNRFCSVAISFVVVQHLVAQNYVFNALKLDPIIQ